METYTENSCLVKEHGKRRFFHSESLKKIIYKTLVFSVAHGEHRFLNFKGEFLNFLNYAIVKLFYKVYEGFSSQNIATIYSSLYAT